MNFLFFVLFVSNAYGVKIGVSKMSTTSTTTLQPPPATVEMETTEQSSSTFATTIDLETTTDNDTTTTDFDIEQQFPPKITTKATTTSKSNVPTTITPIVPATTLAPSMAIENTTILPLTTDALESSKNLYCSCNLLPSACDINCCCDTECNKEILKVFNCFTPSKYPELRLRLEDFEYEHGLPSCKINDGWLCVFRTNTRPAPAKVFHFNFGTSHQYKWPISLLQVTNTEGSKENDFYKFGEPIKVFNTKTLEIFDFELPYAYKPPFCQLTEAIRHLRSMERICHQNSSTKITDEFENLASTTKLLSKPKTQFTDSDDLKDITLDILLRSCFLNPLTLNYNCHELKTKNATEIRKMENFYITEVRITIVHNFTDLRACQIDLIKETIEANKSSLNLWQKYTVQYKVDNKTFPVGEVMKTNDKRKSEQQFSGPLGYLQGEPIIVGKYISNNESEEMTPQNRILNYFKQPNSESNTINLFLRRNGLCHKTNDRNYNLNFGISSLHECTFCMDNASLVKLKTRTKKNSNFTEICTQFQNQILNQFFDKHAISQLSELSEIFVSMLGKPENSSDKWLQLQLQNFEFAPIVGELSEDINANLICRNMLLSIAYEFHVGRFTERGIPQQAMIKNAVLKLGQRHDLEFTLDEKLEVPLTLTVIFYDLAINIGSLNIGKSSSGIILSIILIFLDLTIF